MDFQNFCETFNIFKLSHKTQRRLNLHYQKFTIKKHLELWDDSLDITKSINLKDLIFSEYDEKIIISSNSSFVFYKNDKIINTHKGFLKNEELKKYIKASDKFYVFNQDIEKIIEESFKNDLEIVKILQQKVNNAILKSSIKQRERLAKKFKIKNTSSININSILDDRILYIILKNLDQKFCYL